MTSTLYARFSEAVRALPDSKVPDAIEATEGLVIRLSRHHGMGHVFTPWMEAGRPVDPILKVFDGHTFAEIAAVMSQLRGELADELVRGGGPEDAVRELREGGSRPDGRRGDTT